MSIRNEYKHFFIMKSEYTIKELSELHSVSTRTIEKRLKNLILREKNKVLIPLDVVKLLEIRHKSEPKSEANTEASPNLEKTTKMDVEYDVVEGFSTEEYQEFQKRLIEYPMLQKDLEYHKKSAESHQRQMEKILTIMQERNLLEASNNPKFIKNK